MLRESIEGTRPSVAAVGRQAAWRLQIAVKRAYDLIFAGIGLVACLPLFFVIALAIRIESAGPAFFRQDRVGRRGELFRLWKFRTMIDGAEQLKDALRIANEADGCLFKIRNDPRLTRVGKFLRRSSLDELPQLINVIIGEMSLVGPRPLPAQDYDFELEGMLTRLAMKPGITGAWQIRGHNGFSTDDMLRLDHSYIDEWSVAKDAGILLRTIPTVISGRGAH
jgi:lipopolysaccharide/colanic/teichoic acid biosynthesis glycosyltransferase